MLPTTQQKHKPDPSKLIDEIIKETKRIKQGDPVHEYLIKRGLTEIPKGLGFHPDLYDWDEKKGFPSMVARIVDENGELLSLMRTFLKDGQKAPIASPRKICPPVGTINGAAIRLFQPEGEVLAIAEGIETSIAVNELFGMPCWSVMNANGMTTFKPPPNKKLIFIFADNDANYTGQKAAYTLANRLMLEKIDCEVYIPFRQATDWLDELLYKKEHGHLPCGKDPKPVNALLEAAQ